MPRQLRLEYAGAIYHVMNRGDRREEIFRDDSDRESFLSTLAEACQKAEWQVHAYCLMRNHFHLVIETPQPNLVAGMKWLLGVYTKRFNSRHRICGHLFAGRYKSLIVDAGGKGYLKTVCDYVHLNPVRANLLQPHVPLETFRWSSYGQYLKATHERPPWLRVDRLLGEHGIPNDTPAGSKELARQMEIRRAQELGIDHGKLRRGWCLGDDEFRQQLLTAAQTRLGSNHFGANRRETEIEKAQRIVAEELQQLGWLENDLALRLKGDPQKVRMARRLRQETTMTLKWIAHRLDMGTWTYVSNLLNAKPTK